MADLTPEEARERLVQHCRGPWQPSLSLDAILATLDALAVLVDWPALLEAGERAGKVERIVNTWGFTVWRLAMPGERAVSAHA